MARSRVSDEDRAEIRRLVNAGFTQTEVAEMYGLSRYTILRIVHKDPPPPKGSSKVTVEKIRELQKKRLTYKQIAKELNTTEAYIKRVVYISKHPQKFQSQPIPQTNGMVKPLRDTLSSSFGALRDNDRGRATATVEHVMRCMDISRLVDTESIDSLYSALKAYVELCYESDFPLTVANLCLSLGVARKVLFSWRDGVMHREDPDFKRFAETALTIVQSGIEATMATGLINPVLGIWWEKAHFEMKEADQTETIQDDPLGQSKSAEQIAELYSDVDLPD